MDILKDKVLRKTVSTLAEKLGYDVENGVLNDKANMTFATSFFVVSSGSDADDKKSRLDYNEVARNRDIKDLRNELGRTNDRLRTLMDHLKLDFLEKKGLEVKNKEESKEVEHHCCHSKDED